MRPRRLLIGPGGAKGFYYLGFLLYMEHNHLLDEVEWFAGVSVGSIISLLLVCGYSVSEIIANTITHDVMTLLAMREETHGPYRFDLNDSLAKHGLIDIDEVVRPLIERLIIQKLGYIPTFSQLTKKFTATSTNRTLHRTQAFGWTQEGLNLLDQHMPTVEATCLSSNLPFVFREKVYMGSSFVDGAIRDPYPIYLLDDGETPTLGVYLENTYDEDAELNQSSISKMMRFFAEMVDTPIQEIRRRNILSASSSCQHARIATNNINTTGIGVGQSDKEKMVTHGYLIAKTFFNLSS